MYRIETAATEHLTAIPAIEQAAATLFAEADLPGELRYVVTNHAELLAAQRNRRLWVALNDDEHPVGFAMTDIVDGHAHLDEMDVHPSHARRGLGRRLLQRAISVARDDGHERMTLITFRHLPWNAPFYEKFGFSVLPGENLGPGIRLLLAEEREAGLNIDNRVAMQVDL